PPPGELTNARTLIGGLHVSRRGSGPPIVLTHGFATSAEVWDAQVEALAARHTVVTWDLRGHGRSAPYPGPYTREAALADLATVLDSAGEPALLVGHSVGGYLSLAHALLHPDTVAALAVLSAGPGFRNRERRAAYNRSVETVAERCGFSREVAEVAVQHDSLVIDGLGGITCPTAVIVGADDWHVYVAGSRHLAANLPDARLVEVTGAGHDVHRERPEAVAAVLAELADRVWS
ncbi:MAG: alpha/beta fold hydrolase, partial [Chloroflexi bacterium]